MLAKAVNLGSVLMQQRHSLVSVVQSVGSATHSTNALAEENIPLLAGISTDAGKGNDFIPSWLYLLSVGPGLSRVLFTIIDSFFKIIKSAILSTALGVSDSSVSRIVIASGGNCSTIKSNTCLSL